MSPGFEEPTGPEEAHATPEERREEDKEKEREAEAAEETKRELLAGLASRIWEKVPGFNVEAAKERLNKVSPSEIKNALSDKKVWGRAGWKVLVGSSGAVAGRITRYGLGAATGGAGYAIAIAGGAASGAVIEGIKTYVRERKREISRDEFVEKALEYGLKEREVYQDLRKFGEAGTTKWEDKIIDIAHRLDRYLELTEGETPEEATAEKESLYNELRKEFGVRKKEIIKGIAKGALIGGIGGAAGEALMHLLGLRETAQAANAVREAAKGAKDATVNEALCSKMSAAAREAHAKAYEKAVNHGVDTLDQESFTEVAGKGEGATHIARKAIGDYLAQQKALGIDAGMGKAQLVYAEDLIRKTLLGNQTVNVGDTFNLKGEQIFNAIVKAQNLTSEQIHNLDAQWVNKIGTKTWDRMLDYSALYNQQNEFAGGILDSARREAERAMNSEVTRCARAAALEANRKTQERVARETAERAAQDWLMAKVAIGLGGAGIGVFALKKREALGRALSGLRDKIRRPSTGEGKTEDEKGAAEETEARGEPPVPPESAEPPANAEVPEERKRLWTFLRRKRGVADEELLKELEDFGIPEDIRSGSAAEETEKRKADPLNNILLEKGIIGSDKERIYYQAPDIKDFGKKEGISVIRFPSYSDYRFYILQIMTQKLREWAETIVSTVDDKPYNALGIWADRNVWDKIDALEPAERREVHKIMDKAAKGLFADEFRGTAQINEADIVSLRQDFINLTPEQRRNAWMDMPNVVTAQTEQGMRKLINVFGSLPPSVDFSNVAVGIGGRGVFRYPHAHPGWQVQVIVEVDPSLSEDDMRDYLVKAAEEAKKLKTTIK